MRTSEFVESLQRQGRYAFTRTEAEHALQLSSTALTKGLQRLARKGGIQMLRRGFFVIIPVEYSATGMIPTDWFIAELMQFLGLPYYIGVLSAAALHGAAHQQPQEFHVVVPGSVKAVRGPAVNIRFFRYAAMSTTPVEQVKGYTGMLPVSTPAATALDLVRFAPMIGGLDAVQTVLAELAEQMTPEKLLAAVKTESELAQVQRLGWLLERAGQPQLAQPLALWLAGKSVHKVPLDPRRHVRRAPTSACWHVMVNADVQSEV